jgi:hypothetical protein
LIVLLFWEGVMKDHAIGVTPAAFYLQAIHQTVVFRDSFNLTDFEESLELEAELEDVNGDLVLAR